MDAADLDDFHDLGQLQPDAPPPGAYQEKTSVRPAQFLPMRVSSLAMRLAISRTGNT